MKGRKFLSNIRSSAIASSLWCRCKATHRIDEALIQNQSTVDAHSHSLTNKDSRM
ncbi:hypothetical protein AAK899_00915 [Erysipelotrichaceae bacterium 51-3]